MTTKIERPINYKIIILILGLAAAYQLFNSRDTSAVDHLSIFEALYVASFGVVAVFAGMVAKRYRGSKIFGKTYFSLSMGYAAYVIGSVIWYYQLDIMKTSPYPSLSDIPYFAFYPLVIYHLARNSSYFKPSYGIKTSIWFGAIIVGIVLFYTYYTFVSGPLNFTYYYGLAVGVLPTAFTGSFSVFAVQAFRKSILGPVWGLIVAGIITYTAADVWFYYLEIVNQYSKTHFVNVLWVASCMLIAYALYKHRKTV